MALPEYIIIASDRQVFPFSGQAVARKMLSQEGRIKDVYTTLRFLRVYFYPEITGKKSYNVRDRSLFMWGEGGGG